MLHITNNNLETLVHPRQNRLITEMDGGLA